MVHSGRWSVYGVQISLWMMVWDPNKAVAIGMSSICGDGRLERLYCMYMYSYMPMYIDMGLLNISLEKIHIYFIVICRNLQ